VIKGAHWLGNPKIHKQVTQFGYRSTHWQAKRDTLKKQAKRYKEICAQKRGTSIETKKVWRPYRIGTEIR